MHARFLNDHEVVVPGTWGAYVVDSFHDVYHRASREAVTVEYEDGIGYVTLQTESGVMKIKHSLLLALSFKRSRVPPSKWGLLDVAFVNGDSTIIHPGNVVIVFPEGGIAHPGFKDMFYVPGFTRYVVDHDGNVINTDTGIPMSAYLAEVGYYMYGLTPDVGARTIIGVHRVKALAFKPFPANVDRLDVNHEDGDKMNNDLTNLEWATRKRNCDHAYSTGLRSDNCEIVIKSIYSGKERKFYSYEDCARALRIDGETVRLRVRSKGKLAFKPGLLFKSVNCDDPWVMVEDPELALKRAGLSRDYDCLNTATGEKRRFKSANQAADYVGIKHATFKWRLSHQKNPVFDGFVVSEVDCRDDCESLFAEM